MFSNAHPGTHLERANTLADLVFAQACNKAHLGDPRLSHSLPNDDALTSTGDLPALAAAGSGAAPGADGTLRPEARHAGSGKGGHVTHAACKALAHLEEHTCNSSAVITLRVAGVCLSLVI